MALYIIIYLIGSILCYMSFKKIQMEDGAPWHNKDRAASLILSAASWVGLFAAGIVYLITRTDPNNPAKW